MLAKGTVYGSEEVFSGVQGLGDQVTPSSPTIDATPYVAMPALKKFPLHPKMAGLAVTPTKMRRHNDLSLS
jgi:hypothetical protein